MAYRPLPPFRYPDFREYALVGDGRSAALVGSQGSVDWWCPRRFDAPSAFARLVHADGGGHWVIGLPVRHRREFGYEDATNVARSRFVTSDVDVELVTTMAHAQSSADPGHARMVRVVECTRGGEVDVTVDFAPRFDYARDAARFHADGGAVRAVGEQDALTLSTTLPRFDEVDAHGARATFRLHEGERAAFVLDHADADAPPARVDDADAVAQATLEDARAFWRAWAARCTYDGPYRAHVERSLLALKLLQHAESGTFVAAPTTSLPESVGETRNWDYRYAWLRDGVFIVEALQKAGYADEAHAFKAWLARIARRDAPDRVQMLYRVDGARDLPESTLDHFEGYRRSGPVRVGNEAAEQRQLDTYGEILMCFPLADALFEAAAARDGNWRAVRALVEWVRTHWEEADSGIWELRGRRRHYVYSKAMAWAALDHGERVAVNHGFDAPLDAWRAEKARVRERVLASGYQDAFGAFTQAEDRPDADASALLLPLIGLVDAHDARMKRTVDRVVKDLVSHGFVHRYVVDDALPGNEGAFVVANFWLAMVLADQGRVDAATRAFERALDVAGPTGLLPEEVDPVTLTSLGNYPQGLSHLGLVLAAFKLQEARGD